MADGLAMDMKSEMLTSLTTTLRQADSFGLAESNELAETVLRQGLLAETPMCSAQQHLKWSAAAREWLHTLLALISDTQVQQLPLRQLSCSLLATLCCDHVCFGADDQMSASMSNGSSCHVRQQQQCLCGALHCACSKSAGATAQTTSRKSKPFSAVANYHSCL